MKIKETIERDCCAQNDLKLYPGKYKSDGKTYFCQHDFGISGNLTSI